MENKEFTYTYSAGEQEELRYIREKYTLRKQDTGKDKMERIRRLDRSVTDKAQTVSIVFGIIGALIVGLGMSLIMTNLGELLGIGAVTAMVIGVIGGVVGGVLCAFAYPMYNFVLSHERERVAPEILRLTEELMK